jgi:hypothetical protein
LSAEAEGCYYDDDDNGDGDSDTVVNSRPSQDDSVIQGSSRDIYSSATSRLSDIEALCEDVRKTDVIGPENGKDCDTPNRPITSRSSFDWADDAIKAFQDECESRMDRQKEQGDAAVPKPTVSISRSNPAAPSSMDISSPTWAEVVASPIKTVTDGSGPVKNPEVLVLNDWGFSGKAWDWERNWKG